jgi:hypothetical protein
MTLDVKQSNSSNETPNVMTVGVEKYGLRPYFSTPTVDSFSRHFVCISYLKFHEAPHTVAQLYGLPRGISLTLFYTKMSFKILKFSNRPSVLFPSNQF